MIRTEYTADDVYEFLAELKDDAIALSDFPEEPEDFLSNEHSEWTEASWDAFDAMKVSDVLIPEDCRFAVVLEVLQQGGTIGDVYDRVNEMEG